MIKCTISQEVVKKTKPIDGDPKVYMRSIALSNVVISRPQIVYYLVVLKVL